MFASSAVAARAQAQAANAQSAAEAGADGIALAPARVELEMQPGSETTLVVNLDYHTSNAAAQPARIVASLNDWNITKDGQVEFYRAGTQANSASPWLIYSPAETTVEPGRTHSIRVTVTVPKDAAPGDHLAALVVEQRPDSIKFNQNRRQMVVRYRMACVFYVKVPQLTRRGSLENLQAAADAAGVTVVPTLKNGGNSVLRPVSSAKVLDAAGRTVAELPEGESLPVLGGAELSQKLRIEKQLAPGAYSVRYRIDFQDGSRTTEGVTDLVVK
jgi:P pilus assembly chaperone PapD